MFAIRKTQVSILKYKLLWPYWEEIFLEYSWNIPNQVCNIAAIFRKYCWNIAGIFQCPKKKFFRTQICNISVILPQYSSNISEMFQECFSNISGIFHSKIFPQKPNISKIIQRKFYKKSTMISFKIESIS